MENQVENTKAIQPTPLILVIGTIFGGAIALAAGAGFLGTILGVVIGLVAAIVFISVFLPEKPSDR